MPQNPTIPTRDARYSTKWFLISEGYKARKEELTWSIERYRRLCTALQLTEWELGAVFRCRVREVDKWLASGRIPPVVELHLTTLEQTIYPNSKPPPFEFPSHD